MLIGPEVEQHRAHAPEPAQQHELGFLGRANERVIARHERDVRLGLREEKLRGAAAHHVERAGVRARGVEPVRRLAQLGAAVEVGAGEKIGSMTVWIHDARF